MISNKVSCLCSYRHVSDKIFDSNLIKSKSFGDGIKSTIDFESHSSSASMKPTGVDNHHLAQKEDGNSSDSCLASSDNLEKKKVPKLLKFLVHKKND